MPPVGFEPTVSAGERPQTYALDRAATGTGICCISTVNTQHMQRPGVLVQLGFIWGHVSAINRPSSGQQGIVLLRFSTILFLLGLRMAG